MSRWRKRKEWRNRLIAENVNTVFLNLPGSHRDMMRVAEIIVAFVFCSTQRVDSPLNGISDFLSCDTKAVIFNGFESESHGSINNWRAWRKLHVKFPENRVRPDPLEIPFKVAQTFNVRNELKDAKKKPATGKPHVYFWRRYRSAIFRNIVTSKFRCVVSFPKKLFYIVGLKLEQWHFFSMCFQREEDASLSSCYFQLVVCFRKPSWKRLELDREICFSKTKHWFLQRKPGTMLNFRKHFKVYFYVFILSLPMD